MHCRVNGQVYINTKLYGGDCTQDGCDPFALCGYRVNPVTVRMGELVRVVKECQTFELGQFRQRR